MSKQLRRAARRVLPLLAFAEAAAGPWLVLAIRIWLAQAFLVSDVDMMMHAGLSAAAGGWRAVCAGLLAVGLLARPAAAVLLVQTWLAGAAGDDRLFWSALLGWLVVFGAGPLAIDRMLRGGLASSAVPAAAGLARLFEGFTRRVGPAYRLALRLWLAAAPAGLALAGLAMTGAMRPGLAAWLPAVPSMVATLAAWAALGLAALLAVGLATRPAALVLLLLVPLSHLGVTGDTRLYWALLLAIHVVHGGGAWSADRRIAAWISRAAPAPEGDRPHVIVVGGGFGGVAAVQGLANAACRVTLIDQRNHTLFQPLLYQVATAGLAPGDIATPIRALFRDQPDARILLGQVSGVDTAGKAVLLARGRLAYDYLVLATGARHSYFGRDDWAAFAPGLKSLEDSTAIRRRLLLAFEAAEEAEGPAERSAWLTFVIVGGGPTGVELAGAIAELARHGMAGEFRSFDPASAKVVLVQAGERLLPGFPPSLSADAAAALRDLGVEVRLDQRVEAVTAAHVTVSGVDVPTRTVLWAAGVMASPAADWLGVAADRAGRVPVGPDLGVAGCDGVFAIGDTAASLAWNGKPVPGLAPAAKQGGAYVARVIRARLRGRRPPKPFRYRHMGSLATIGRQSAVADFGWLRLRGAVAWWLWGAVHVAFLVGGRNRVMVLIQWLWAYLTFRRGTRLITTAGDGQTGASPI